MEADIENVKRKIRNKTRIPLSVRPLPALPKQLLQHKFQDKEVRRPLRTINSASVLDGICKTNECVVEQKLNDQFKVDSRFATFRSKNKVLDSKFKVFKDDEDEKDRSVITISDSESENENYLIERKQRKCTSEPKKALRPGPKPSPLEPNRVRNIKRKLKRKLSREFEDLSPVKQTKKGVEESDVTRSPNYFKKLYTECIEREYSKDMFSHLLSTEKRGSIPTISSNTRASIINWLMRLNGPGGNPAVVQTASWYLDSVLSIYKVESKHLLTVAAACFWIGQKHHGRRAASASKFVKRTNNAFSTEELVQAENEILNKLKFPTLPVIPQDYITYLSWCLDKTCTGEVEMAATFICMCGMLVEMSLCSELPSVVAAACVKNALLLLKKSESILQLQSFPIYQAAEKKAGNMSTLCLALRRAVRLVGGLTIEQNAPMIHFGLGPHFIAQKIVGNAKELADVENTEG